MAGQVMEAAHHHQHQARLQPPSMPPTFAPLPPPSCKNDVIAHHHFPATTASTATSGSTATASMADMAAYLQQLQDATAAEANKNNGGARGEQCPRCASHDTKFCYYNNYNTSQPRHFCRACRRYWTLGGSLRNVPIGGSTRKRPRLAHHHHSPAAARRAPLFVGLGLSAGTGAPPNNMPPMPSSSSSQAAAGGLLGSLFALGAAAGPLLEGPTAPPLGAGFDLGLGLPAPGGGTLGGAGDVGVQMQGLGLRGGGGGGHASGLFWPAGLLDSDSVDTWKMLPGAGVGASAMWPEFSAAATAAVPPPQTGGLLHGGAQLM
ncbi:unnamed protein product [Urochloa decumbens]|uniref:Dof zinc finger protein n=1 Tax=Urochloa decumbens TaxID=240449 RepID=A0ABC8YFQ7_9POAL